MRVIILPRQPLATRIFTFSPPAERQVYFRRPFQLLQQYERRQRDLPMHPPVSRLSHRVVVRERDVSDPRRLDLTLHRERHGWYPSPFHGRAYQPHGPVTQGSRRREKDSIHLVLHELRRDLGGGIFYQRAWIMDGAHEAEVSPVQRPNDTFRHEVPHRPQR